jgi:Flp pilus assembly protein TadG
MSGESCPHRGLLAPSVVNHREQGAVMAEFALVIPLLIIMLIAIAEFGIAFNRAQAIEAAAREGARLASLSTTTAGQVNTRVATALTGVNLASGPNVAIAPGTCAGREGQSVTVTVTGTENVVIPLVNSWTVNLSGQAVFRCEA